MVQFMTVLMLAFLSVSVYAKNPEITAIKAMSGCYKVNFDFEEIEKTDPNYPISSKPYHNYGFEWIEVDFESEKEVHLQHVLVTPNGPLKHWRQEWQQAPTKIMSYKGDNYWETGTIAKPTEDLWIQRVYQVDDSPRYECAAPWTFTGSSITWYCSAWSPLPRREYSQRDDYNILDRGNFVILTSKGWIHHQLNNKILSSNGQTQIIAKEKGTNTYTKIDDSKCEPAKAWWKENKKVWHDIQAMWKHIYDHHPNLKLKAKVEGKTLWMHLFELADTYAKKSSYDSKALQKEAHDIIHTFFDFEEA